MTKYRAVLMVPSVVEFENDGPMTNVTEQVKCIADGLGKAVSKFPFHKEAPYAPMVLECVVVEGTPPDVHKKAPL